jgi:cobalt-zinc-cadmium efflux system protein
MHMHAHSGHDHHAGHEHDHSHGHAHDHARDLSRSRLGIVLAMTAVFMVAELVGGLISNSLALIADSGHMLSDVGALGLSAFALWFSARPATSEKSYGYKRIEILAALANGATLLLISVAIIWQAWARLREPPEVQGTLMLVVAIGGLAVNAIAAVLLHASSKHSLNVRGAYLHVLGDMLGSVGAIAAALLIIGFGWTIADPVISVVVALLILAGSWRLVRESVDILLEAVPAHIDIDAVRRAILELDGVEDVFDLHVWTLTSGHYAMSGHALIREPARHMETIRDMHDLMHRRFSIGHVTVQIEHRPLVPLARKEAAPNG